ncbi:VWA domain-containing protein [Frischella sp. Ac48]|uniref:hypothetical protein n=1 Tax=Frischella sp. Ac48 TaxID=2804531 RepID=UPI001C7C9D94|nr:hypothetical protein [Frischella sp. Ac48]MBX4133818.1 VWA domain-containing protein [Frischella sp. Ac48]
MKNTKNKLNQKKKTLFCFFQDYTGNILIPFAIMLPTISTCLTVGLNNAYILEERIRLSEATNEASLGVSALPGNGSIHFSTESKEFVQSYINYYLKNKIDSHSDETNSKLDIALAYAPHKENEDMNEDYPHQNFNLEYYISYSHELEPLIKLNTLGKLGSSMQVSNGQDIYGNTRKLYFSSLTTDVAFIVDFSGSSTCLEADKECNKYTETMENTSSIQPRTRIKAAMNYVRSSTFADRDSSFKFALIPYDIGVPIANNEKNILGGQSYSCSVPYKLKPPFNEIDFEFWANKNILFKEWKKLKDAGEITNYLTYPYLGVMKDTAFFGLDHSSFIFYYLDYYNYKYYSKIFGPANSLFNDYDLQKKGYCKRNYQVPGSIAFAKYKYSCGIDQKDYPLSDSNQRKVEKQYAYMVQLYDYMYSDDSGYNNHLSLANMNTIDFDATINNLFSENYEPITFTRPIVPATSDFTPFQAMCSSPLYNNGVMFANQSKKTESELFDSTYWKVPRFKNGPYLVDLTFSNKIFKIADKQNWKPGGGTDTMSGFLTAIPLLAKSKAKRKVFVVLSDGRDDSGADQLTKTFLKDKNLCKITSDFFREKMGVERVDFYFVKSSTKNNVKYVGDLTAEEIKKEFGPWVDCVKMSYFTDDNGNIHYPASEYENGFANYLYTLSDDRQTLPIWGDYVKTETGAFVLPRNETRIN